jgi:hypothetical protein
MGATSSSSSKCLAKPDSIFETWTGIRGVNFRATCFINAFVLNSIYTGLTTWIIATASTNLNEVISHTEHNRHSQRAATWAATFGVAFFTSFSIYLLMFFIFGYGGGLETAPPSINLLEAMLKRSKKYHTTQLKLLSKKIK